MIFKIGSINVSSFRKLDRQIEIARYLYQNKYDFLLMQETRLTARHSPYNNHYTFYRQDEGVGTLIMAKKKFNCNLTTIPNLNSIKTTCITVKGKGMNILIISIYVPNRLPKNTLDADLDKIHNFIDNRHAIIGGDFNTGYDIQARRVHDWINNNQHHYRLASPTSATYRLGNILDHFVLTRDLHGASNCMVDNIGLEHNLITIEAAHKHFIESSADKSLVRKWRRANWDLFADEVISGNRTFIPDESNISNLEIDQAINSLTENILAAVDRAIPVGERGGKRIWIVPGTVDHWFKERRRLKRLRSKTLRKLNADPSKIDQLNRAIAAATAEIMKEINTARDKALDETLAKAQSGGDIFKAIKELNTCGYSKRELALKDEAGKILNTTVEKQSTLSNFYEELYRGRTPPCNQLCDVLEWKCDVAEFTSLAKFSQINKAINPITSQFANYTIIAQYLKALPSKTSSGDDNISNLVIKHLPMPLIATLTRIINHCVNNRYFPKSWKTAVVTTIPKKVGHCSPSELRPISLTSNLGKILELVIIRNIQEELREGAIPDHQFGFRTGHSTVNALSVLSSYLDKHMKGGFTNAVCSLDVKKAFDTVWHDGIIFKMKEAGCSLPTCRIVQSFLEDRWARIKIDSSLSSPFRIARGVPQGSRLGPLLFNIYMADLKLVPWKGNKREKRRTFDLEELGTLIQYADDTLVVGKGKSPKEATDRARILTNQVRNYMTNWGIELNEEKTDFMITRPKNKMYTEKIRRNKLKIGNIDIEPEPSLIYLGVLVDCKGTYKLQAENAARKARQALGACRAILANKALKLRTKKTIYKTLIRSRGAYAATMWLTERNKEPLMVMERWAMRYAMNIRRNDVTGHWPSNVSLYKDFGSFVKFDEFISKCKTKEEEKNLKHVNKLVLSLIN